MKKQASIIFIPLAVIAFAFVGVILITSGGRARNDRGFLAGYRDGCSITGSGAFISKSLGFAFEVPDGYVVCERPLDVLGADSREFSLWDKDFLEKGPKAAPNSVGMVAKITVNSVLGAPKRNVISHLPGTVSGRTVDTYKVTPSDCRGDHCSVSEVVEIHIGSNFVSIEKFGNEYDIFPSFRILGE